MNVLLMVTSQVSNLFISFSRNDGLHWNEYLCEKDLLNSEDRLRTFQTNLVNNGRDRLTNNILLWQLNWQCLFITGPTSLQAKLTTIWQGLGQDFLKMAV